MNDTPKASGIRHRIIGVTMLVAFILYLDRICMGEIVKSVSFSKDLALPDFQIGRILGAFFFAYARFQTPHSPDADPRSDRPRCGGRESKFLAVSQ